MYPLDMIFLFMVLVLAISPFLPLVFPHLGGFSLEYLFSAITGEATLILVWERISTYRADRLKRLFFYHLEIEEYKNIREILNNEIKGRVNRGFQIIHETYIDSLKKLLEIFKKYGKFMKIDWLVLHVVVKDLEKIIKLCEDYNTKYKEFISAIDEIFTIKFLPVPRYILERYKQITGDPNIEKDIKENPERRDEVYRTVFNQDPTLGLRFYDKIEEIKSEIKRGIIYFDSEIKFIFCLPKWRLKTWIFDRSIRSIDEILKELLFEAEEINEYKSLLEKELRKQPLIKLLENGQFEKNINEICEELIKSLDEFEKSKRPLK